MANQPRYAIIEDGSTFHVTWQCHNQDWLLREDWSKQIYYDLLLQYKDRYKITFYSYSLMSNHPHLTGTCENRILFSDFFRTVNGLFARKYNKAMKRRGQVVMDRFKSPCIETDEDLLKVIFYNDFNAPRAHIVDHPKDYKWSSFHYYAYGKEDPLITPAPSYLQLGTNPQKRQEAYLAMVEEILRNDWRIKKPYSSVAFIGNPDWVTRKNEELKEIRKHKAQSWRKRYRLKFGKKGPP